MRNVPRRDSRRVPPRRPGRRVGMRSHGPGGASRHVRRPIAGGRDGRAGEIDHPEHGRGRKNAGGLHPGAGILHRQVRRGGHRKPVQAVPECPGQQLPEPPRPDPRASIRPAGDVRRLPFPDSRFRRDQRLRGSRRADLRFPRHAALLQERRRGRRRAGARDRAHPAPARDPVDREKPADAGVDASWRPKAPRRSARRNSPT